MLDNIKLVFLDVDNTLLDFNKNAELCLKITFNDFNVNYKDNYYNVFKNTNDKLWHQVEKKEITRAELHEIRFDIIFKQLGINLNGKEFEKNFLDNLNKCTIFVDGAMDLVKYLSKKYVLCSASNAPYVQQMERLKNSGIKPFLTKIFVSEALGINKPDKLFFEKCVEALDIKDKSQMVMIGDSLSADILGAKNFGIKSIWFNFEKKSLPNHIIADYTVDKLEDIKKLL